MTISSGSVENGGCLTAAKGSGRWLTDEEIQAMYRKLNLPDDCYIHRSGKIYRIGSSFPKGVWNDRT